ncbi:hypothetical protein JMJ77_0002375 [Colletotrichum scovillei]|uniref:Uncharacterized protein n=1 Tax=Colletotrichum scovillei TaxID=1209932 RepID=A0A9P7RA86_9PEZI|nr:hypothetical protein JMJ77_0002375 [Colletotrichum scovillei]KAG7079004.1 hypothetical protein JMJ78_0002666 [Colletotrichum scovillei]
MHPYSVHGRQRRDLDTDTYLVNSASTSFQRSFVSLPRCGQFVVMSYSSPMSVMLLDLPNSAYPTYCR